MQDLKGTYRVSKDCDRCLYASIKHKKYAGCKYLLTTGHKRPENCFTPKEGMTIKVNPYGDTVIK